MNADSVRLSEPLDSGMPNSDAYRLGVACRATMNRPESDEIDRGLVLLRNLNEAGYDVVKRSPPSGDDHHA